MKRTRKPIIYVEKHLLRSLNKLDKIDKHIDGSTSLKKTELRILIQELREPLMRAVGYIFPDEEIKQNCPNCNSEVTDNSCTRCDFTYNLGGNP